MSDALKHSYRLSVRFKVNLVRVSYCRRHEGNRDGLVAGIVEIETFEKTLRDERRSLSCFAAKISARPEASGPST